MIVEDSRGLQGIQTGTKNLVFLNPYSEKAYNIAVLDNRYYKGSSPVRPAKNPQSFQMVGDFVCHTSTKSVTNPRSNVPILGQYVNTKSPDTESANPRSCSRRRRRLCRRAYAHIVAPTSRRRIMRSRRPPHIDILEKIKSSLGLP